MTKQVEKNSNNPWLKPAMIFLAKISGVITFSALVSVFLGMRLDKHFSTLPLITIILTVLGFTFSIFIILKEIKNYKKSL